MRGVVSKKDNNLVSPDQNRKRSPDELFPNKTATASIKYGSAQRQNGAHVSGFDIQSSSPNVKVIAPHSSAVTHENVQNGKESNREFPLKNKPFLKTQNLNKSDILKPSSTPSKINSVSPIRKNQNEEEKGKNLLNYKNIYNYLLNEEASQNRNDEQKRWEYLHELDKKKREAKKIVKDAADKEKHRDPNLTFKPTICKKTQIMSYYRSPDFNVVERTKLWAEQRDEKIKSQRMNDGDKGMEECTFKPLVDTTRSSTVNYFGSKSTLDSKGVDQFLRRQIIGRQTKEEKQLLESTAFYVQNAEKSHSKRKNKITLPNEFKLGVPNKKTPTTDTVPVINDILKSASPSQSKYTSTSPLSRNSLRKSLPSPTDVRKNLYLDSNDLHFDAVTFDQAVNKLHNQLHSIKINVD